MKLIQKNNRQLRVDDVRAEELIKAGYTELDPKTGKPVEVELTEKDLKKENAALKKENKALKAEVDELKAKLQTPINPGTQAAQGE